MALITAVAVLAAPAAAAAEPTVPLGHDGRWITDARGRVVLLHGVNMVNKVAPFHPADAGFEQEDAAFLRDHGFNTVRLGITYAAVEPSPGQYDDAYLNQVAATEQLLAEHGIFSQLDFHQDMYSPRFEGNGFPDWAVQDDGLPAEPKQGFPANYVAMPALQRAYDHFWANSPVPGSGAGLQDHYAAAFRHVAARFRSARHTIGYDIMNEPWPGSIWPTCAQPLGCPLFDIFTQAPFHQRVITRVREVEPEKLIWYEPMVIFNFGADSSHPATGDRQTGFSFHVYCLPGAFMFPGFPDSACEVLDERVFDNADQQARQTGDALLLSEFGATNDYVLLQRIVDAADAHMISWQYWHYCECDDPTTQGPGVQGLIGDAELPPSGDNVNEEKLAILERPYPQVVAGTPQSFGFDREAKRFGLSYSTTGVAGDSFAPIVTGPGTVSADSPQTEVFVPELHYPDGYKVNAEGAAIASEPGARTLRLIACPDAEEVQVSVVPAGSPVLGDGGPDCEVRERTDPGPGPGAGPGQGAGGASAGGGPLSARDAQCARLRKKMRRAKQKARRQKLRRQLRRRGC